MDRQRRNIKQAYIYDIPLGKIIIIFDMKKGNAEYE